MGALCKVLYISLPGHCFLPHFRFNGTVLGYSVLWRGTSNALLHSSAYFCMLLCP